ncbi:MAG: argininosuccinate lyase [Bacteroidia bacterium]|jgi:argininosuccinate lyase
MKLWNKTGTHTEKIIEAFTVGNDKSFDLYLAPFDIQGSQAHVQMLNRIGLLTNEELSDIQHALEEIKITVINGQFAIEEGIEDIHSQIELILTRKLGETGKKIHSGRSRNDQVLVDIKLFLKHELKVISRESKLLFDQFIQLSSKHAGDLMPGYTHMQLAMPSSFGLLFSAYAESLVDDMELIAAAYRICDKNPLGSGSGFGSSFPLDRQLTTELLQFNSLNVSSVYAQMTRGKTEKLVAMALASIAATLSKHAQDICLYSNQQFGFVSFPDALTTGSSIMPHKKNPDVFELIRAKCNRIQALPNELTMLAVNLPSGYHRDFQLTKEILFPALNELHACLHMTYYMLQQIIIRKDILKSAQYDLLFSVEEVNKRVLSGHPFREAYKQVGESIANGTFSADRELKHTHIGSIGNLGLEEITNGMNTFEFLYQSDDLDAQEA